MTAALPLACVPAEEGGEDELGDTGTETETGSTETDTTETDSTDTTETESTDTTETDTTETESTDTTETDTDTTETDTTETDTDTTDTDTTETDTTGSVVEAVPPSCAMHLMHHAELSFHITQGECVDGVCTWDYDPAGAVVTQIVGEYAAATGEFSWTVAYDPAHWRASTTVAGTASFTESGDESSDYGVETLDSLGVTHLETVHLERSECELTRTSTRDGLDYVLQGTYSTGEPLFTYTDGQMPPMWTSAAFVVDASGSFASGTANESLDVPSPNIDLDEFWWNYVHTREYDLDGNDSVDFQQYNGLSDWSRQGTCSWDIAGTETCDVAVDSEDWGGSAEWTKDYAGNGEGVFSAWFYNQMTMEWGPQDCPITWVEGSCSYACPGGQMDDCGYFLM
ncbi:hypothetical protein PPSIR1_09805 [Plesiocystis pacifica SIR-1]|uniref:Uncharacterized protein n=1 Tax=Plesiocystis pacifica SIR-1 TaxID=391625 RepID=A6G9S1_9BACT|nr:hypothetical protein [Plesiocystis pacifica]EDM77357.1 hypothetical protein PPSIR1_09805 [Plesiocystis pacifica SIR-1]